MCGTEATLRGSIAVGTAAGALTWLRAITVYGQCWPACYAMSRFSTSQISSSSCRSSSWKPVRVWECRKRIIRHVGVFGLGLNTHKEVAGLDDEAMVAGT